MVDVLIDVLYFVAVFLFLPWAAMKAEKGYVSTKVAAIFFTALGGFLLVSQVVPIAICVMTATCERYDTISSFGLDFSENAAVMVAFALTALGTYWLYRLIRNRQNIHNAQQLH